jgi:serine/threonine protein kinase
MKIAEAVDVASQVAAALTAAHEAGIAHRDIKPENVMVRRDGYVKVLDFCLAKLTERQRDGETEGQSDRASTESGLVMGTPRYMSPEQARGEKVDGRTDIFSLGVMLYEMVAGCAPFAGATTSEVIAAILRDEPQPLIPQVPEAPCELERIVGLALRKDRAERYQSVEELLSDLKNLQQRLGMQAEQDAGARATSTPEVLIGQLKPHKLVAALTLLLAVVAVAVYFNSFGGSGQTIDSLAVLPFVNVGANPDAEYLSDGITDGLINSLSRLPKLKVMSRSSALRYKNKEADAQAAGKALGVRAVLTGKVTQRGDDLLISVALVDVRDNRHLWGEQYSYKKSNLLGVQPDLARDVSQQLRLRLSSAEQQQLVKRGTENAEAYELYLKGALRPEHFLER